MMITAQDLRSIAGPKAEAPLAEKLVNPINRYSKAHGITTPLRPRSNTDLMSYISMARSRSASFDGFRL